MIARRMEGVTGKKEFKMKNFLKIFGIIVIIAAIVFSMTGCPEPDDGGPTYYGDTLTLSGQVYTYKTASEGAEFTKFTGDLVLSSSPAGVGEVKGGKLTYTVGVPATLWNSIKNYSLFSSSNYTNVTCDDDTVKYDYLLISEKNNYYGIKKEDFSRKTSSSKVSGSEEEVRFVYVNGPVTITGEGKSATSSYGGVSITYTYKNIDLSLKAGWNTIYIKKSYSGTTSEYTVTTSLSVSNPDLRWIYGW